MKANPHLLRLLMLIFFIYPVFVSFSQTLPTATNDTTTAKKFHHIQINVLINDFDADDDSLEVYKVAESTNCSVGLANESDSLVYYYSKDFTGWDSFEYWIREKGNHTNIDSAWAFVEVTANELPKIFADTIPLMVGDTLVVNIFDHAFDPDGDEFILINIDGPRNGEAAWISDSLFKVSITHNYHGLDSTKIKLREVPSYKNVNDYFLFDVSTNPEYPFAVNDTVVAYQGDTCYFNLLANDYDLQGDALEFEDVNHKIGMDFFEYADSVVIFVPGAQADKGLHQYFEYQIRETDNTVHLSNIADVFVEVLHNPNIPVAVNDTIDVLAGYPAEIDVLMNDIDINDDELEIFYVFAHASYGVFTYNDSLIIFSPYCYLTEDFSIYYQMREKDNPLYYSGLVEVYVRIIENNDQPMAYDDEITMSAYSENSINLLQNDYGPDNASIRIVEFANVPDNILATITFEDSTATIDVPINFEGRLVFPYRFIQTANPAMKSNWANLVVTVIPNQDSLLAQNDSITLMPGFADTVYVLNNDINPANDSLFVFYLKTSSSQLNISKVGQTGVRLNSNPTVAGDFEVAYTIRTSVNAVTPSSGAKIIVHVKDRNLIDALDINNIRATFSAFNINFMNPYQLGYGESGFEVPKGSGINSIFSNALWIGGMANDSLFLAGDKYGNPDPDFYPGPISDYYLPENYTLYGVWKLNKSEIEYHIQNYNQPDYQAILPILSWPGNGNTILGQAEHLAPFFDVNGNGHYDPLNGDYPLIRGDQALYFIYNDGQGYHNETYGNPLDVEIHGMAYAFDQPGDSAFFNAIFVHYDFYNRSSRIYDSTYIGVFNDFDLGNPHDDYTGCDVSRGAAFVYNGDEFDENAGSSKGYKSNPPVQSMVILGGPEIEADNLDNPAGACDESVNGLNFGDGIIDNERYGMTRFSFFESTFGAPIVPPDLAPTYYNKLKGFWKDNTPVLYGGKGHVNYNSVGPECRFMYPGASDPLNWGTGCEYPNGGYNQNGNFWTEETAGNTPFDIRGLGVSGPFTFEPGKVQSLDIAYVFARDYNLGDELGAMDIMNQRIDTLRNRIVDGGIIYLPKDDTKIPELENLTQQIKIFPNPVQHSLLSIDLSHNMINQPCEYKISDLLGRTHLNGQLEAGKINKVSMDGLDAGLYIITINAGAEVFVNKLIVGR